MKKLFLNIALSLAIAGFINPAKAQQCDPSVPVFTANLTGNPNGTWISPASTRNGFCCASTGNDRCVAFILTLDPSATGILFDVASGAIPPGALYYQVNCGPMAQVGQPICLSGAGPHYLTFCKPGNNTNTYSITSLKQPSVDGTKYVSQACQGYMVAKGLEDTSITWTSVPYNATHNSYLNCSSGCDSVTVTPSGTNAPPFVDYRVCGMIKGGCGNGYFCDTVRVNFVNNLSVSATPKNPVICYGGSTASVTAQGAGGRPPYTYSWSNGATTQSTSVGIGTYIVTIKDSMDCSTSYDTVTVTGFSLPINANAGPDQLVCKNNNVSTVQLSGSVTSASGGVWQGGGGTFSPNNTTLNTIYTPSSSEVNAGSVNLMLMTTGNSGCPADTDWVRINISPEPDPVIIAHQLKICSQDTIQYEAPYIAGHTYSWSVTGGSIIGSPTGYTIQIVWTTSGTGTVSLTQTSFAGCVASVNYPVTVNPKPSTGINGPLIVCENTSAQYQCYTNGIVYSWSPLGAGGVLTSSSQGTANINWSSPGTGSLTLTMMDTNGCVNTANILIQVKPKPRPNISGSGTACLNQTTNTYFVNSQPSVVYQWNLNGGTIQSGNGTSSISVVWNSVGSNNISVTALNLLTGCDSTISMAVTVDSVQKPVVTADNFTGCAPMSVRFNGNRDDEDYQYSWSFGDGTASSSPNPSHKFTRAGTYYITVVASKNISCKDSAKAKVVVNPSPAANFSAQTLTDVSVSTTPFVIRNLSSGAIKYFWDFGNGDTSSVFEPLYQYNSPGIYLISLVATNSFGCKDYAQNYIEIKVPEDLYIPNAFSPNGDAKNDRFRLSSRNIAQLSITIYNRWGDALFTSKDTNFEWDGTYHGKLVQSGVYVYKIKATGYHGTSFDRMGTVTIVR